MKPDDVVGGLLVLGGGLALLYGIAKLIGDIAQLAEQQRIQAYQVGQTQGFVHGFVEGQRQTYAAYTDRLSGLEARLGKVESARTQKVLPAPGLDLWNSSGNGHSPDS